MSCAKGMRGCRVDCHHRAFVEAYRAQRAREVQEAEAVTQGYAEDERRYRRETGLPGTFGEWLERQRPEPGWRS